MFVEEPLYLKALHLIGIALDEYRGRVGWEGSSKEVFGRGWCQFQLGNGEDRVNPLIEWYIKPVD